MKSQAWSHVVIPSIVEGKGRGVVGLLSGSPGVGKTLTAEAVSEVTHRPLYVVNTGELGIEPDSVDHRLEHILDITRRWGCVLLIDEADVFLSARGQDLARDTLVKEFPTMFSFGLPLRLACLVGKRRPGTTRHRN